MVNSTETRTHATVLYPGSFMPESGRSERIEGFPSNEDLAAVFATDPNWFAIQVSTQDWKRWTDGDGNEEWRVSGKAITRRIYVGEVLTKDDVAALPGNHDILLSNMRGNGWDRVVHTRAGNWQPLEANDAVIDPTFDGSFA